VTYDNDVVTPRLVEERRRELTYREWLFKNVTRPRVTWCEFTHMWVVNYQGDRHICRGNGGATSTHEEAFRGWSSAFEAAGRIGAERVEWARRHWHWRQARLREEEYYE
jgi:hypothetical protein